MKRLKIAVIALFAFVAVSNVNAQDENNPWAVSFGVNIIDFYGTDDFSTQVKDLLGNSDWNFLPSISRITGEKYLDKGFTLQLAGSLSKIDHVLTDGDADYLYYNVGANVKYDVNNLIGETGWFDPFVYLGGAYVSADSQGEGMLNVGMGFNTWFNDNLGLSFQTGTLKGFSDKVRAHYQSTLGVVIKFGGKDTDGDGVYDKNDECPNEAGLVEFNGCPDADNDGIKDSEDACPYVAGLAAMNGCPDSDGDGVADKDDMCPSEKGTKANKGCPDSDGDGVINKDDKCPSISGPAANNGCPWPDTDGDGVLDKDDKCINKAGPASNSGCPELTSADTLAMLSEYTKGILFDFDRAVIKDAAAKKLDMVYDLINSTENIIYVIEGYTDSVGTTGYNKYLSERRAESVKTYLVKKGMAASKLETVGFGETNPTATNATADGRAKNRRVVIKLNE
tara:strand:- start:1546 stop:2898 length:1353 start_codon:yes stop_codon:yes gene_type:complete